MAVLCKRCKINWEHLWKSDENGGDEVYEYCPVCNTDTHLQQINDKSPSFFKCLITGVIKNAKTGDVFEYTPKQLEAPRKKRRRKKWLETEDEYYARMEREQDAWVEQKILFPDEKPEKPKVERLFEWEEI